MSLLISILFFFLSPNMSLGSSWWNSASIYQVALQLKLTIVGLVNSSFPFPGVSALPQRLWWRWLWRPGRFEKLWTEVKKAGGLDFHGGISGLSSALEYFPTLGVDALWITPIFASPMADFGYDISDYRWGLKICQNVVFWWYSAIFGMYFIVFL